MNVKSFTKLMVLMLVVATMASNASAAQTDASWTCKIKCALECLGARDEHTCYALCLLDCAGDSEVETLEGQCNLDCVVSKCFHPHPDVKKVKGCVNSCSQGCKKV